MKNIFILVFLLLVSIANCTQSKDSDTNKTLGLGLGLLASNTNVNLTFNLTADGRAFQFNTPITVAGQSNVTFRDARFYVSSVKLIRIDGGLSDVTLTSDNKWQTERVALLDYETGGVTVGGSGASGTADTNNRVIGTVASGIYTGVQFELGVPADLNHLSVSTASSPLNIQNMYWAWASGYKFVKLEFFTSSATNVTNFHLGSQNCPTTGATPPTSGTCANEFRPTIRVLGTTPLNISATNITVDLDKWLDGYAGYSANRTCMPAQGLTTGGDNSCNSLLTNIGLQGRVSTSGTTPQYSGVDANAGKALSNFTNSVFKF